MATARPARLLSKSRLIAFRQCPKRLWLKVHHPELREDSASTQASFLVGHQVGAIAKRIYDAKGAGSVIDVKTEGYDKAFARSAQLLGSRASRSLKPDSEPLGRWHSPT
jgi:hypothetical protein